jgi:Sec-independent protein secretion pathway component TatC
VVLFELSVQMAKVFERRRERAAEEEDDEDEWESDDPAVS